MCRRSWNCGSRKERNTTKRTLIRNIDPDAPPAVEQLDEPLFTGDCAAHKLVLHGAGEDIGMPEASFLRPDGVMLPLSGFWEGDAAALLLTDACYACPGRFLLVVRMRRGDTLRTVYAMEGNLLTGTTDAVGGDALPLTDVRALAEQVRAMEANARLAAAAVEEARQALTEIRSGGPGRVFVSDPPKEPKTGDLLIETGAADWGSKLAIRWADAKRQSWQEMGRRYYTGIRLWDMGAWQEFKPW